LINTKVCCYFAAYVRLVIACNRVLRVKAYVGMAWKGKAASFYACGFFSRGVIFGGCYAVWLSAGLRKMSKS
jgi:hypothetical protein